MARARNIKPGFFANEMLAECDPLARLLFAGLWCLADRDGRLEDRPKRIRAEILPYDQCDPDGLLTQLEKHGFILRYAHGEQRFIQVLNFGKHQNPHVKEAKSTIPSPFQAEERDGEAQDKKQPIDDTAPDKHQTSTRQAQCEDDPSPERAGLIPDSGFLIPDPLRNAGEPAAEPGKPTRPSRGDKTLKTYLAECKTAGVKPIPDDHAVRRYCESVGVSMDMAAIAWMRFREEHITGTRKAKRYSDWPAAFHNSVKANWYKLWVVNTEGEANWTSLGIQARRAIEAEVPA